MQASSSSITVFIPTFNRLRWLRRAVESVLQETRVPILLHIFDNASTDGTGAFVAAVAASDSRVRYTLQAENVGSLENYRTAFQSVGTEYFVPLADDDWLLPDYLFDAYQQIEKNRNLGAVIFVTEERSEQGHVFGQYPSQIDKRVLGFMTPEVHLRDWMRFGHYHWSSVVWRKMALDEIGLSFLDVGLPCDVDFQLQIFCRYPVCLLNKPGAVYLHHDKQASGGFNLTSLPSWVSVFSRLDRNINTYKIFSPSEYHKLRNSMQGLLRDNWKLSTETVVEERVLLTSAVSAGFRIGDWETAFELIQRYTCSLEFPDREASIKTFVLPEFFLSEEPDSAEFLAKIPGFLPSLVAWFKLCNGRLRMVDGRVDNSHPAYIGYKNSDALNEVETLKSNVGKLQAKLVQLRSENQRLKAKIGKLHEEDKKRTEMRFIYRVRRWLRRS